MALFIMESRSSSRLPTPISNTEASNNVKKRGTKLKSGSGLERYFSELKRDIILNAAEKNKKTEEILKNRWQHFSPIFSFM
ncbi:MAG: hypothetical protein IKQ24_06995 [Verrucomicrobia bacterium]|nr:hypothetical protein [Verrucomicrobiota bacterium]